MKFIKWVLIILLSLITLSALWIILSSLEVAVINFFHISHTYTYFNAWQFFLDII